MYENRNIKRGSKILDLTAREIGRAIKSNNLIRDQYKLCYLFNEQNGGTRDDNY